MTIPPQYNQLMPYLILKDSSGFRQFMSEVFDAKDQMIVPGASDTIMHGEIKIGDAVIMFAEASHQVAVMNAGIFIYVDNVGITYRKALLAGASTVAGQEPSDKDYGRACGVKDRFGNTW